MNKLIDRAKSLVSKRKRSSPTVNKETLELIVSFLKGEINASQAAYALDLKSPALIYTRMLIDIKTAVLESKLIIQIK